MTSDTHIADGVTEIVSLGGAAVSFPLFLLCQGKWETTSNVCCASFVSPMFTTRSSTDRSITWNETTVGVVTEADSGDVKLCRQAGLRTSVSGLVTVGMLGIQAAALIKVDTSGDSYSTVMPVNTPETPPGLSTPRNVKKKKKKGDKDNGRTWRTCRGVCCSQWCLPPSTSPSPVYCTAEEEEGRSTYWEQLHSNFLWCRIRIRFLL